MSKATSPADRAEYYQRWYVANLEAVRAKKREYYANNRVKAQRYLMRYTYGLTDDQIDGLVLASEGRCAICNTARPDIDIDHDHATTEVRGLVCRPCNNRVLAVLESPLYHSAVNYLATAPRIRPANTPRSERRTLTPSRRKHFPRSIKK